jgi:hypothetical protein
MRHARWQHRASTAGRRWLLMQSRCTRCMVPSGDVTFDREIVRHRREASFGVRSQGEMRSHARDLIRGRESAPERHDGDVLFMRANGLNRHRTWGLGSRGSPPCVSARVGCTWRSKLPAASDPMLVVPRERRKDVRDRTRPGKAPPPEPASRRTGRGVGTETQSASREQGPRGSSHEGASEEIDRSGCALPRITSRFSAARTVGLTRSQLRR